MIFFTLSSLRQRHTLRVWLWGVLAVLAGFGMVAALLVGTLFPRSDELANRAAQALEDALGTPVSIGALTWQLLPQPRVELLDVVISQPTAPAAAGDAGAATGKVGSQAAAGSGTAGNRTAAPITLQRVTVLPALSLTSLWNHTVRVHQIEVDGAHVPQRTLARLRLSSNTSQSGKPDAAILGFRLTPVPIDMLVWRSVLWTPHHGPSFQVSGDATFDPQSRLRTAAVRLLQAAGPTDITLNLIDPGTTGNARWTVKSRMGGGTVDGELALSQTGSDWLLSGRLTPANVEVASAMEAFNRRSVVRGKASGNMVISARAAQSAGLGALMASLQTDTRFKIGASQLTRFDVGKAVRSVGRDTSGHTPLDSITGQMSTRNTPNGMLTRFVDVTARAGVLSAVGSATVANGEVDALVTVDLVDGVVGVPLRITGPITQVKVSVPPSALAGAAVGTAVLPGVGTVVGARLGAALGSLFGSKAQSPRPAKAAAAKPQMPSQIRPATGSGF